MKYINKSIFLFLIFSFTKNIVNAQVKGMNLGINVLAIGNADYKKKDWTMPDINFSARNFLSCFKNFAQEDSLLSNPSRVLSKVSMLQTIKKFVNSISSKTVGENVGIIYYCGHGISSLSGSLYFIPGNSNLNVVDTTFEYLSEKLLNIDEIKDIIISAQSTTGHNSRFIIMADCCGNIAESIWYKGISFLFSDYSNGVISYDSNFIQNVHRSNSTLRASVDAYYDSSGNIVVPKIDSSNGPIINEFDFIGELIRSNTFNKYGNQVYYSAPVGKKTELVRCPNFISNPKNLEIAPICRRTLIYFKDKNINSLEDYLKNLIDEKFDLETSPALINPSRNADPNN